MTLLQRVTAIVADKYPESAFYLMSEWRKNYQSINESGSNVLIIFNNEIEEVDKINENVNLTTSQRVQISVLLKDDFDSTDLQSNNLVEQAKEISRRIYVNLWLSDEIDGQTSNGNVTHTPTIKELAGIRTGVLSLANWKYKHIINCST